MVYEKVISGRYISLRSIEENDAEFSLQIRQSEKLARYFAHKVSNDIENQKKWIENQRKAEGDYFFIAESTSGKEIGTIGIYDIEGEAAHLGRLLMVGNPFQTFEAVILAMDFAFGELKLKKLYGDVHIDNTASLNISEAVGFHFGEPIYEDDTERWVRYGTAYEYEFNTYRTEVKKLIYRG